MPSSEHIQIHGEGIASFPERPNLYCTINYNDPTRRSDGMPLVHITTATINGTGSGQRFDFMIRILARVTGGSWKLLAEKPLYTSTWSDITRGPYDIVGNSGSDTVTFEIGVQSNCTCHEYLVDSEIYSVWSAEVYVGFQESTYTFNDNGGSGGPGTATKIRGQDFVFPSTIPVYSGYKFIGWSNPDINGGQLYQALETVHNLPDRNLTWTANWEVSTTCTLTYNANGGSGAPASQEVYTGSEITLSNTTPSKNIRITYDANGGSVAFNYQDFTLQFSHWNTQADGTGISYDPGQTFTLNTSMTLYAIYISISISSLPIPTRDQCEYVAWFTSIDGGTQIPEPYLISQSVTIYARYNYIISYNTGTSGIYLAPQTKVHGESITLSDVILQNSSDPSQVFAGWSTSQGSSVVEYEAGAIYSANAPATLYVVWQPNTTTFTVIFDLQGGTYQGGGALEQTVQYGHAAVPPNDPTRIGLVFCGWLGDYSFINSDRTIRAMWNTSPIWIFTESGWFPLE